MNIAMQIKLLLILLLTITLSLLAGCKKEIPVKRIPYPKQDSIKNKIDTIYKSGKEVYQYNYISDNNQIQAVTSELEVTDSTAILTIQCSSPVKQTFNKDTNGKFYYIRYGNRASCAVNLVYLNFKDNKDIDIGGVHYTANVRAIPAKGVNNKRVYIIQKGDTQTSLAKKGIKISQPPKIGDKIIY